MAFCSSTAKRECCDCTLLDCCALAAAAVPVALSTGAGIIARRSDNLDAWGASELASRRAPTPCQKGFVLAAITMISTAVHAATIASQLKNVSAEKGLR
jgi:hypothetical protein